LNATGNDEELGEALHLYGPRSVMGAPHA